MENITPDFYGLFADIIADLTRLPGDMMLGFYALPWPAATLLLLCGILLFILAVIDFRTYLLPDKFVLPLAIGAIGVHLTSDFALITPVSMLFGAIAGGGFLWGIRWLATKYYGRDPLGLGDVKLMIAGGLLIGIDQIFMAITIGAFIGVFLGIILWAIANIRSDEKIPLARFQLPAGPGFCLGILVSIIFLIT